MFTRYNTIMISHILDFIAAFFTNITAKKIIGALLVFGGMGVIAMMGGSQDANKAVLLAVIGIILSGIGLALIYHDIAKDKLGRSYSDVETLSKTPELQRPQKPETQAWHMDDRTDGKKH